MTSCHAFPLSRTRADEEFAGRDELRYTGSHPNEPVGCH